MDVMTKMMLEEVLSGESEDQAMALILNDNLQLMKSVQKIKTTTNSKNK